MRIEIVSWNCRNGFDDIKASVICKKFPDTDIFIIQECRRNDIYALKDDYKFYNWYGDDQEYSDIGVAVFSRDCKIEFTDVFLRKFRYVVPYIITTATNKTFTLFAVWTKPKPQAYDQNVVKAVQSPEYSNLLNSNAVVIGDFNTFAKNEDGLKNLAKELSPLVNCAENSNFWKTHTYYHGKDNSGIDDFCFFSEKLYSKTKENLKIEVHVDWKDEKGEKLWPGLSDHCPISIEFEL